jgi:hypothetical protein
MGVGPIDAVKKAQIERQATYKVTIAHRLGVAWSRSRPVRVTASLSGGLFI